MKSYVVLDPDGWIIAHRVVDGPPPPRNPSHVEVPIDTAHAAGLARGTARLADDGRTLLIPQDDRQAWRLLHARGRYGRAAYQALASVRELRQRIPGILPVEAPGPSVPPARALPGLPYAFAEVAGLQWRPIHPDDLDAMTTESVAAGMLAATCPTPEDGGQCQPPEAHAWLMLARRTTDLLAWSMVLEFQGRPLQYEIVMNEGEGRALYSFTLHTQRERPSWFWREAERPIFEGLQAHGIETLVSRTWNIREDWIQSLIDNYGAIDRGPFDAFTRRLEFPLNLGRFQGWPSRRQVGFDQTTGAVRVWEATAADLPAVRQLIQATVPQGQRAIAMRILEEWFHLDRATLLLGSKDGTLRYARVVRHRKATQASLAFVGALFDEPEQATVTTSIRSWMQQAGYTTASSFVPERLMTNPNMQAQLTRAGATVVRTRTDWRENFVEVVMPV